MAAAKKIRVAQGAALLESLEQRLDILTVTLSAAEIAEKSIDIVKEIKELNAILRSLREAEPSKRPHKVVVVWGGPPTAASGRVPASTSGTGKRTPRNQPDS